MAAVPPTGDHGLDVVVTGGEDASTAILSLNSPSRAWRSSTGLPYPVNQAATVPFEGSFLIVGGSSNGIYLNTILEFDVASEIWNERPERLANPRARHTAVIVTADAVQCE